MTFKNGNPTLDDYADNGGAIYFKNAISNSNINATYINNEAGYFGGANFFENEVLNSNIGGTYVNNTVASYGGANYFANSVLNSNIGGTYANNTATENGGANFFNDNVSDSNVTGIYINNIAPNSTICFHADMNGNVEIRNAIFLNNTCEYEIHALMQNGGVAVKDSWFGNNVSDYMIEPNTFNVKMDNWLFLNATVDHASLFIMDLSNIAFKLYSTDGRGVYVFDNSKLPAVNLTLTATNGDVDKTVALGEAVQYMATEHGKGSVTAIIEDASYTFHFENILRNVFLSVIAENITWPENEVLGLTYNDTATGKFNITLKGKNYNKTIEVDINQTITITDLSAGDYDVVVEYEGDNVFSNATSNASFTVKKMTTEVIPDNETINLFVDDEYKITYTLKPDYALGNISFYSNDSNIVSVDSLSSDIVAKAEGWATITVSFSENENYTSSNATITVNVKKIPTQITVSSSAIDMKVNDETDRIASLNPVNAGNLIYSSSDENIVKIENGKIKGLKEGNATITVSFSGNEKYYASENTINVTVSLNNASISVNNSTLNLHINDNFTIVATTVPEGLNVTFVSDNSGIFSVDENGTVTALKEGTGFITVNVGGDGVYVFNTTVVTVNVDKIPTEISVATPTLDLKVFDEFVVGATLIPDVSNLTFISSNSSVAVVENGTIKAIGMGNAVITVSFVGDDKYYPAENKTIAVNVSLNDVSVSVNNSTLDLLVDEKFTIVATTVPEGLNVTYVSDNSGVVSVDENGTVTALKEGTGFITVNVGGDGVYVFNTTVVTVNVDKIPTEISVATPTLNLKVFDEFVVGATLIPDGGNLTFISSNSSVAFKSNIIKIH